jgi:PAS domain S-box-containing protein
MAWIGDLVKEGHQEKILIEEAFHMLVADIQEPFFILDSEGYVRYANGKASELIGTEVVGRLFRDVGFLEDAEALAMDISGEIIREEKEYSDITLQTQKGSKPVQICVKPLLSGGTLLGTICIIRQEHIKSDSIQALEKIGMMIQKHSNVQKIFEIMGEELSQVGIDFLVLHHDAGWVSVDYHTLDMSETQVTEFIMGIPFEYARIRCTEHALRKINDLAPIFFNDISSIISLTTPAIHPSELTTFFSLLATPRGVAIPLTRREEFNGLLVLLSDNLSPQDAPVISAVGIQVSAALERADVFQQMVTDLQTLETQMKIRTEELERVKSKMESIVQSSVDAIMALDMKGTVTFVNKGVEKMLGCSQSDILNQPITSYFTGDKWKIRHLRHTLMIKGHIEHEELSLITENGRIIHTLASLSLLKNEDQEVLGMMLILKDITEQKRLQQTLESLNKAASRIQKVKTRKEIFSVTTEELNRFSFFVVFIMFNERKTAARIVHYTETSEALFLGEGSEYEIPLHHSLYSRIIKKKEAIYLEDVNVAMTLLVPSYMQEESEKAIETLGISNKNLILAPLLRQDETVGILAVISDVITSRDCSSIMAFANQVSTALENARLLEESRKRADELARNLEKQHILRNLNSELFLAQSLDEVLDAAIQGIFSIGKSFSSIVLTNEDITEAWVMRVKMESRLLQILEKTAEFFFPGFSMKESPIPLKEGCPINKIFKDIIPTVSPNVTIHGIQVTQLPLGHMFTTLFPENSPFLGMFKKASHLLGFSSGMIFPIIIKGTPQGALMVMSTKQFTQVDFNLMRTMVELISSALERIRHSEQLTETFKELRAIQRINTLLNTDASLQEILDHISLSIQNIYHYKCAFPILIDTTGPYLSFEYVSLPTNLEKNISRLLGEKLSDFKYPLHSPSYVFDKVLKEKKCIILRGFPFLGEVISIDGMNPSVSQLVSDFSKAFHISPEKASIMVAPLPYGDEVIGALFLIHEKPLRQEDYKHLENFLDPVGIAIAKSRAETQLRQSLEELKELDKMKSEFIDIASHELRTPLTTLKLYLEMMAMDQYGQLSASLQERIRMMEEGVNRLEEIINQTLIASRVIKNKLRMKEVPVSFMTISTEIIHQLRPLWKAKHQHVFLESSPHLSQIHGDENALCTVLSNLLDNAIRYSPEHSEIYIRFRETAKEIEGMVKDQGCGIPPEDLKKVFDEFYIVPSKTEYARMDGRTGLGLFIAKGIVEQHGGRIWVESEVGKGSTFHFVIPKS